MLKPTALRPAVSTATPEILTLQRPDAHRRHVLNRVMQEKSGRLYCNEELDFEIPSLEFYTAR
jgi:hypothetical protein